MRHLEVLAVCFSGALVVAGCGSGEEPAAPAASTTTRPSSTTAGPTSTAPPARAGCTEVNAASAAEPSTYREAALDRFGPLEAAPSLTIDVEADRTDAGSSLWASRLEGGVLVIASRSPDALPPTPDSVQVAVVDHDGTIRWSRCLDDIALEAVVAAPEHRPANALVLVPIQAGRQPGYQWVQLSLRTGAEQPTFATALRSVGVDADGLARLTVAGVTDRYALLVDIVPSGGPTSPYQRIVRYDLVADTAVDVTLPPELSDPTLGPCGMQPQPSLSSAGDVVVTNGSLEAGAAVVARWHDGTWSRDPLTLATVVGVHPSFACTDRPTPDVLRGVDALGQVRWTDPDLTRPGTEGTGLYPDGAVTVGQVCSHRTDDTCDAYQLIGIDPTTGQLRWTQPGLRLVAGDPADGYVLAHADDVMNGHRPGWVLLDDRTGRTVPGQSWDDPAAFNHPCCGDLDSTTRAGGLVLVTQGHQVRVWYPQGTGGEPRTARLP